MHFAQSDMFKSLIIALLVTVLIGGCSQTDLQAREVAKPETILIESLIPLVQMEKAFDVCRNALPEIVIISSYEALPGISSNIVLFWGTEKIVDDVFFLAEDKLVFIQSKTTRNQYIDFSQLEDLYAGLLNNQTKITLWTYQEEDPLRQVFKQMILNGLPTAGEVMITADPLSMAQEIVSGTNAIGYLPQSLLPDGVRIIKYPERLAENGSLPILADIVNPRTPAAEKVIACLQTGPGHDILAEIFP